MSRDRSGLATTEPEKPKPGCTPDEVTARRLAAANARQDMYNRAYDTKTLDDGPKFADFNCLTLGDIGRLYIEMEENMQPGVRYMARIQAVR